MHNRLCLMNINILSLLLKQIAYDPYDFHHHYMPQNELLVTLVTYNIGWGGGVDAWTIC